MSKFYCFTCEVCEERTFVTESKEITKEKNGLRIGPISYEIERGCYHVCIDDQIAKIYNRIVI